MMDIMPIERAVMADYDAIATLWLRTVVATQPFIRSDHWRQSYVTMRTQQLPLSSTWVCRDNDGHIIAFISIMRGSFISALFVDLNYQGQGLGSRLLAHAKARCSHLETTVYTKNTKTVSFFKRHGFTQVRQQQNATTGATELVLEWKNMS